MSRVTAIISALVICIIVCLSWAVNHYRDNAITYKAARQKSEENWSWRRGNYWHADASAWCCCARCKIRELADAKAERCSAWWCCRWSSSVAHQSSLSVSVHEATTASGVDNAASPTLADTTELRLLHPQREADHYNKTTGRNPEAY